MNSEFAIQSQFTLSKTNHQGTVGKMMQTQCKTGLIQTAGFIQIVSKSTSLKSKSIHILFSVSKMDTPT